MALHFESTRTRYIIMAFKSLAEGVGKTALAKKADELLRLYEDMVKPRAAREVRISGHVSALLQHEIQKRELLARGYPLTAPLIKTWGKEVENLKHKIEALNIAPKFKDKIYLSTDKIDLISNTEMFAAKRLALEKLSEVLKKEIKDFTDTTVKGAKSAKDLGITFGSGV